MTRLRPADLADRLHDAGDERDRPFLLDIRPREAYQASAIDGSTNVPVYESLRQGEGAALRDRLDEIPPDREIVVVCKMGVVAKRATRLLDEAGYDATTLAGGMHAWTGYQNGSLSYKLRALLWRLT